MNVTDYEYNLNEVGKIYKSSKLRFTWKLKIDRQPHEICLTVSKISGKYKLTVDGVDAMNTGIDVKMRINFEFEIGKYKAELVRSNQALYDYCIAYGLPLISGKDSMKNDFGRGKDKISVPPTLLFTVIGKLDDCEQAITMDAKAAAKILEQMSDNDVHIILGYVGAKQAAQILSSLPPERVAKLSKLEMGGGSK